MPSAPFSPQAPPIRAPRRFEPQVLELMKHRIDGITRQRITGDAPGAREAAVLVTLCDVDGESSVLLTKRSEKVGTHKGQVSFPGGMRDAEDADVIACALRETEEEIGFARHDVKVLGLFHEVRAITGVRVTPVIGYLGALDLSTLRPNADEIADTFTLTLRQLLDPAKRRTQTLSEPRGRSAVLPVFEAGPHPVWGLTAYILDTVLREILIYDEATPR